METATPAPSPWAFHSRAGWARYGVALAGIVATVAAMVSYDHLFGYVEAGLLAIAGLAMIANRVDVHVFLRAMLWGALGGGALLFSTHEPGTWAVLGGSAAALLALGSAGLDSNTGPFSPRVLRRTLVTMMVVGLSVAHVLAISAVLTEIVSHEVLNQVVFELPGTAFTRVAMFGTPALMVLGVLGLSRTKSWGLFAYVGALMGVALTIGLALSWSGELSSHFDGFISAASTGWVLMMAALWASGAILALGAAVPVLSALIFRRRPSAEPARPWGRWAHAGLVCVVTVGAVLVRYA